MTTLLHPGSAVRFRGHYSHVFHHPAIDQQSGLLVPRAPFPFPSTIE